MRTLRGLEASCEEASALGGAGDRDRRRAGRRATWITTAVAVTLMWGALSGGAEAAAARTYSTAFDVPYRFVDAVTLRMDLFIPDGTGPWPTVLLIHGGGWRYGDRTTFHWIARDLAGLGFLSVTTDYRLAPPTGTWHAMAPVEDLQAAMVWLRDNIGGYGGDPARVAALGGSAGGNLVEMLDVTGTPGLGRPDAVVSLSGPSDLPAMRAADSRTYAKVVNYVGFPEAPETESLWQQASPLYQGLAGGAPTFLAISTAEQIPVSQAVSMADALTAAGVFVRLEIIDGSYHSTKLLPFVWSDMIRFLRNHF